MKRCLSGKACGLCLNRFIPSQALSVGMGEIVYMWLAARGRASAAEKKGFDVEVVWNIG